MLAFELVDEVVDQAVVKVLTTQMSISGGRFHFKDTLFNGQERHIKSTTAQIENEDVALALGFLVETVGNSRGGGLVDDTKDIKASNQTSIFGSLALRVVEISRDCDDSVVDGAAEVRLSSLTHLR